MNITLIAEKDRVILAIAGVRFVTAATSLQNAIVIAAYISSQLKISTDDVHVSTESEHGSDD